ncbi:MAG: hypothetical protein ACOYBS_11500 [Flavobacterium sp.]
MKFILTILIIGSSLNIYSQDMKLKNKDKKANIDLVKSGKFIQAIKHPKSSPGYFMIINDSLRFDYGENGKYFTKSRIKFIKPDLIESIAYETTVPNFNCHMEEIVETKILETSTQDSLIRIKERINKGKWHYFVLRKVKN